MAWKPRKLEVDFELLQHSSALEGLQYLIKRRTDTIYEHLSELQPTPTAEVGNYGFEVPSELPPIRLPKGSQIREEDNFGIVNGRMLFAPVHPLTLSMAISISIVRRNLESDFVEQLLTSYIAGIRIPPDMTLVNWEGYSNDHELSRVLDLDDGYTTAFLTLGESLLVSNRKLVPPPPLALKNNIEGNRIPTPDERAAWLNSVQPSRLDILCGAWLAANPIFQLNVEYGWRRATWSCKELNSAVHNAIEESDYLLDQANQAVNRILEGDSGDEVLKEALARQRNAARQVKRSRRFYEWDADEIWSQEASQAAFGIVEPEQALPHHVAERLGSVRQRKESND